MEDFEPVPVKRRKELKKREDPFVDPAFADFLLMSGGERIPYEEMIPPPPRNVLARTPISESRTDSTAESSDINNKTDEISSESSKEPVIKEQTDKKTKKGNLDKKEIPKPKFSKAVASPTKQKAAETKAPSAKEPVQTKSIPSPRRISKKEGESSIPSPKKALTPPKNQQSSIPSPRKPKAFPNSQIEHTKSAVTESTTIFSGNMGSGDIQTALPPRPKTLSDVSSIINHHFVALKKKASAISSSPGDPNVLITKVAEIGSGIQTLQQIEDKIKEIDGSSLSIRKGKIPEMSVMSDVEKQEHALKIELKNATAYLSTLQKASEYGPSSGRKNPLVSDVELENTMKQHQLSLTKTRQEVDSLNNEVSAIEQRLESFEKRISLMSGQRKTLLA